MSINKRIHQLRKHLKISQVEFADKIGVTQPSLSDIENGKTVTIDKRNIKLICGSFNVSEEWLVNGTGEMFDKSDLRLLELVSEKIDKLTESEKKLIIEFIRLSDSQRAIITQFIKNVGE